MLEVTHGNGFLDLGPAPTHEQSRIGLISRAIYNTLLYIYIYVALNMAPIIDC